MGGRKKLIHCGLFGHVDSGKTAIASVISEMVSTAGLDAHPQAKKRGISIDLGFTSFDLEDHKIALVDAPGHADLIKSVVASANIIDIAILVIDAVKGPEIQTGEHMVILESLNIQNIIVALNKIDLIKEESKIEDIILDVQAFLANSGDFFKHAPIIPVSAIQKRGFSTLLDELSNIISRTTFRRDLDSDFIMPFDHHFKVKGFGTVLTGTVLSGKVKVGDTVEISPVGQVGKVKSIRIFKEDFNEAIAGDRAGIAISGIDDSKMYRGCMVCKPGSMKIAHHLLIRGKMNKFFKHSLNFKSQVHLTAGMLTVPATIFPFEVIDGKNMMVQELIPGATSPGFTAYIHSKDPITLNSSFTLLLSRLDLPPQELRIASRASIEAILEAPPEFYRFKKKVGKVKNQEKGIIEGLAQSFEGAKRMVGKKVHYTKYLEGKEQIVEGEITETFGTKGNVKATFKGHIPAEGTAIVLTFPKQMKITIGN